MDSLFSQCWSNFSPPARTGSRKCARLEPSGASQPSCCFKRGASRVVVYVSHRWQHFDRSVIAGESAREPGAL